MLVRIKKIDSINVTKRGIMIPLMVCLICLLLPNFLSAGFVSQKNNSTKIFYSETDVTGWDAVMRGRVDSLGVREIGASELHQS